MNTIAQFFRRKKPLTQEVIEVWDRVTQIRKLGYNKQDDYPFLRILDLCDAFKGELFQRGIMFVCTDRERLFEPLVNGDGEAIERCTVLTAFEAVRGKERLELGAEFGSARDFSDKALAIAQTAAFKAFLKRSSMTYGQEDDPETKRDALTPKESVRVGSYQRRALESALRHRKINPAALSEELSQTLGFPITYEQIADLPRKEFDEAMRVILEGQDLTTEWYNALDDLKAKRPQPITNILDKKRRDEIAGD